MIQRIGNPVFHLTMTITILKKAVVLATTATVLTMLCAAEANAGDHRHHGHNDSAMELGLSNTLVYQLGATNLAYGLHTHGLYTFAESPFGLGLGYELIVGDYLHHSVGPIFCYRPSDPFNLCVAPGATFDEHEVHFGTHVEVTYEVNLHGLHLGPTLGFAYSPEDTHISLGLHTGYAF
jgi:hypothetical protein